MAGPAPAPAAGAAKTNTYGAPKLSTLISDRDSFSLTALVNMIGDANTSAITKLGVIQNQGSSISIANMFDMQMVMNRLTQYTEMSSSVVAAANTAMGTLSRNIK